VALYREKRYVLSRLSELKTVEHAFAVQTEPLLTVRRLADAQIRTEGKKKVVILTFTFEPEDAQRFAEATALHAGRRMAMLVDGEMFFPPKEIEGAVTSGVVQVQGYFHPPVLRRLVAVLNTGPLPADLELVSSPED
jgi:preprotein translocase subunit SecD